MQKQIPQHDSRQDLQPGAGLQELDGQHPEPHHLPGRQAPRQHPPPPPPPRRPLPLPHPVRAVVRRHALSGHPRCANVREEVEDCAPEPDMCKNSIALEANNSSFEATRVATSQTDLPCLDVQYTADCSPGPNERVELYLPNTTRLSFGPGLQSNIIKVYACNPACAQVFVFSDKTSRHGHEYDN